MLLSLLLACTGTSDDSAKVDTDVPTDTDTTPTDTNTTPACVTVNSGTNWAWNGECPQMKTKCDIVVTECTLAIDYEADGGMTMDMPYGGVIVGDVVTFNDDNGVTGCVGTVIDADTIEGTCASGCTFDLTR